MINSKQFRKHFIQILNDMEKCQSERAFSEIEQRVELLKGDINKDYQDIIQLSKYSQNAVLNIVDDNRNLGILLYRYRISQLHNMPDEAEKEVLEMRSFVQKLKEKYIPQRKNKNAVIITKVKEIITFLKPHIELVGETQAIKDLQRGLSLLNKNRRESPIEAKNILKKDGIYGPKTNACLCDACKNYAPRVIKKYIKKGIQNNIIFDTKNKQNVDTKKLMHGVCINLERKI